MTRLSLVLLPGLLAGPAVVAATAQGTGSDRLVHLRYAEFDPAGAEPAVPQLLRGGADTELWIVQFDGLPTQAGRDAVRRAAGEVHGYLPENAYVVRMSHAVRQRVVAQRGVRSATYYHPAFRLEPALIAEVQELEPLGAERPAKYNIVVVDKHTDKPALGAAIERLGGRVTHQKHGSLLLEAALTRKQLARTARLDQVLWIDRVSPTALDMNNARVQGGANHIETQAGYTGRGINGHVYEGVQANHTDFNNQPTNVLSGGEPQSHGHCTAGIVFGNGKSHANGRGMAPDAKPFYTTHTSASESRWKVIETLVRTHEVMFTTASWGNALTTFYTSLSAEADDIVFDHDIPWTQSQGSASSRQSRPQAWAKNVFSIGSVTHRDNANPSDDSWRAGSGSTGPALDGRQKPDLVAYDDSILCSDMTGSAGYNRSGDYYANFGGTSGATAICAGHNALAIQMFTDALFSPKRKANGTRWENRPHFATLKALQIANAAQYPFTKSSTDNRREHVGWGFPDLKTMYDRRALHYVVDETDILRQGDAMLYQISVAQGQPELKVSLCFADPAGNPSATRARVNNLSLRVIAPNGTTYWGNVGLSQGNYSVPGGVSDAVDTVENVFIQNPAAGIWQVEVGAWLVAEDAHVETPVVDADFGLVAVGGKFVSKRKTDVPVGAFVTFGSGCPTGPGCSPIFLRNWNGTSAGNQTTAQSVALMDWTTEVTTICGVDLHMAARSGTVDIHVSIYDMDSANALPRNKLVSETVRVSALKTVAVPFKTPIVLQKGVIFFIVLDNADKLVLPVSQTGEGRLHYEMRNNKWSRLFDGTRWQYRVHGIAGKPVPALTGSGSPSIGKQFDFELSNAQSATPGVMFLGVSDRVWGAINLPFRYATSCDLLVSGEFLVPFVTDANGTVSVPLRVPNDKGLVRAVTFQQFLISDPTNPAGWIVSNAGRLKIGE